MSEQVSRRFRLALAEEIKQWQKDEVISPEVAERLATMYPVSQYDIKLISLSLIVGATLIGLASLSLVASNWQHIDRIAKLVIAVGAMLAAYTGAWHCCYEPGKSPKLGGALIELGTMIFGACIWMLTQFLNFDANLSTGLLYWAIGTALVTFITRSKITCCLLALQLVSLQSICLDSLGSGPQGHYASLYIGIPTLAALIWLCARVRSRAALFIALLGTICIIGCASETHWAGLVVLGSIMFSTYLLGRDRWEWFVSPFVYLGTIVGLLGTFMITFGPLVASSTNLEILLGLATVPLLFVGLARKPLRVAIIISFAFAVLSCAADHFFFSKADLHLLSSVVLFVSMTVAVLVAAVKLEKPAMKFAALGLAAMQLFARFGAMQFDPTFVNTFAFAACGAFVMLSGAIGEARRRKFLCTHPN